MKQIKHIIPYSFLFLLIIGLLTILKTSNTHAIQLSFKNNSSIFGLTQFEKRELRKRAANRIYFMEPNVCVPDNSNTLVENECTKTLTGATKDERIREVIEKFGDLLVEMQIEYGVPWEAIILNMYQEAEMGKVGEGSVAKSVEKCGYINVLGFTYGSKALYGLSEEQMGDCKVKHSEGMLAAQYKSYEDMIASFYPDYLRNGAYDAAFQ